MLKGILYVVLGLGGLIAVVAMVGALLPKGHRAARTALYKASPDAVFARIADVERYPEWRGDVTKVEVLPDDGAGRLFREHGRNGVITYRIEAATPPTLMRTRI